MREPAAKRRAFAANGMWFDIPQQPVAVVEKPKPPKKPKLKNDPALGKKARELRDRWLEQVNSGLYLPQAAAKYDLNRELNANQRPTAESDLLLPAA